MNYSTDTEDKIIESATRVFVAKGRTGASMQDIADEAGINRTLLNYYYRSKEKLFDAVFERVFLRFLPEIAGLLTNDLPMPEKMENFVDRYTHFLQKNPLVPIFILQELVHSPERLVSNVKSTGIDPAEIIKNMEEEFRSSGQKQYDPKQLIVSIFSLTIFPFVAKPMLQGFILGKKEEDFDKFIDERRSYLKETFISSIREKP